MDETEHSIIELSQFSQSLENGQSVFTGRGSYVLLSIDSKLVHNILNFDRVLVGGKILFTVATCVCCNQREVQLRCDVGEMIDV